MSTKRGLEGKLRSGTGYQGGTHRKLKGAHRHGKYSLETLEIRFGAEEKLGRSLEELREKKRVSKIQREDRAQSEQDLRPGLSDQVEDSGRRRLKPDLGSIQIYSPLNLTPATSQEVIHGPGQLLPEQEFLALEVGYDYDEVWEPFVGNPGIPEIVPFLPAVFPWPIPGGGAFGG